MADIVYSNVRELTKQLQAIEPELRKQLIKDLKAVAKPVQAAIVARIPNNPPLRGMRHNGRTSWDNSQNYKGRRVPAKSVTVKFRSGGSRRAGITSLLSVQAMSPVVSMIDQARVGRSPQGIAMIRGIGMKASRYVWPAAEQALPQAEAAAQRILNEASQKISRGLR